MAARALGKALCARLCLFLTCLEGERRLTGEGVVQRLAGLFVQ